MTRYYLDTEFHEDGKTIELISIGIVCEDGRELYCVSHEFDPNRCNDWVKQHVLPQLPGEETWMSRRMIAGRVADFVMAAPRSAPIEFWAYYAAYDWVVLCQLFGSMLTLPAGFPQFCFDLKQLAPNLHLKDLLPMVDGEHDALEDARWNRAVHQLLQAM